MRDIGQFLLGSGFSRANDTIGVLLWNSSVISLPHAGKLDLQSEAQVKKQKPCNDLRATASANKEEKMSTFYTQFKSCHGLCTFYTSVYIPYNKHGIILKLQNSLHNFGWTALIKILVIGFVRHWHRHMNLLFQSTKPEPTWLWMDAICVTCCVHSITAGATFKRHLVLLFVFLTERCLEIFTATGFACLGLFSKWSWSLQPCLSSAP